MKDDVYKRVNKNNIKWKKTLYIVKIILNCVKK